MLRVSKKLLGAGLAVAVAILLEADNMSDNRSNDGQVTIIGHCYKSVFKSDRGVSMIATRDIYYGELILQEEILLEGAPNTKK